MKRPPLIATLVVLLAVATMIGLGVWQLGRAGEKEAALASFRAASGLPAIAWPVMPLAEDRLPLFRRASGLCLEPTAMKVVAGRNARGETGYSHWVDCRTIAEGPGMRVDIGWSRDPQQRSTWSGGPVTGIVAPDTEMRMRLVSTTGLGGFAASAPPNPEEIPNNHRGYAFQWFSFAAIALVIYALALRARGRKAHA